MTAGSSSSSDVAGSSVSSTNGASDKSAPLIRVANLSICFRLHRKRNLSLREMILSGRLRSNAPLLWALRDVSFTCSEGQTLGIIGFNGAGKSTLCLALARILEPDEGELTVRGTVSPLLGLGAGFVPDLSGRENIQLCSAFLGMPRAHVARMMDEIIAFSELETHIDEPLRHYSSGMRARLGFSIAATLNPEILILDEVLAVGDRLFHAKSKKRIEQMMAQSKIIIVVSHAIGFLRSICTHCLWLHQGRVAQYGVAAEVLDAYEQSTGNPKAVP